MLDRLPVTTAAELREQFAARNRLGVGLEAARGLALAEKLGTYRDPAGLSFGLSTGTEGPPGVFITSPGERASYIGTILGKLLPLSDLTGCRVALLLRHDNRLYSDAGRGRLLRIEHFDTAMPLEAWAGRLCGSGADVIIGFASILLALATSPAFVRKPLRPRILLVGGEPLFPSDAARLRAAFATTPRPIYQATEGFLALACRHGRLHVNEDILIAEWRRFRDCPHRAVPVITDFSRTTQDIWRTQLADVVSLAGDRCPCGSRYRALSAVEGRLGDVLYARDAGRIRPVFPFDLDAAIADVVPADGDWQIRQPEEDSIVVATAAPCSAAQWNGLRGALAAIGGWSELAHKPLEPRPPEIKRRRFVRLIDPHSDALGPLLLPPRL